MVNIIVILGVMLVVCAFLFSPKKTMQKVYYALKYALFKPIEWLIRAVFALLQIKIYVWGSFCVLCMLMEMMLPEHKFKFVFFVLIMIYGWLILILFIRNFRDESDRDFVRMTLAQLEHKMCFKNQKLSMYPHDWHWFE